MSPGRRLSALAITVSSVTFAFLGCASVLDIDGNYVLENSQSTEGGSGSSTGTGGTTSAGGASSGGSASGGSASGGSVSGGASSGGASSGGAGDVADAACVEDGGSDCSSGTKCCGGACVAQAAIVGCGSTSCSPCRMPPASGTMVCLAGECAVKCNANFALTGSATSATVTCEPIQSNTGGVTGAGGAAATGGAAPGCDAKLCPGCGAPGPFGCCKNDNECGCSWTPSGSGYCL